MTDGKPLEERTSELALRTEQGFSIINRRVYVQRTYQLLKGTYWLLQNSRKELFDKFLQMHAPSLPTTEVCNELFTERAFDHAERMTNHIIDYYFDSLERKTYKVMDSHLKRCMACRYELVSLRKDMEYAENSVLTPDQEKMLDECWQKIKSKLQ